MDFLQDFFAQGSIAIWHAAAGATAAVLLIAVAIRIFLLRHAFKQQLLSAVEQPEEHCGTISNRFSTRQIAGMQKLALQMHNQHPDADLIHCCGLDRIWIERAIRRPTVRRIKLLLQYVPEEGLFAVFLAALHSGRYARIFMQWLAENDDVLAIRRIALSGKGEVFNGARAHTLLLDRIDQIRELAGHPEWSVRYMALKILLHDDDERTARALRGMFHDPHSLLRKTIAEEFKPQIQGDTDLLYEQLIRLLSDDYVYEVRHTAKQRLIQDFADRYQIHETELSPVQSQHVVEQLLPDSAADQDYALHCLDKDNLEIRLQAARYLSRTGALSRLLVSAEFSDTQNLERVGRMLRNAAEVGETGFLQVLFRKKPPNPAVLSIAADILMDRPRAKSVSRLFELGVKIDCAASPQHAAVYQKICYCAAEQGDSATAGLIAQALSQPDTGEKKRRPLLTVLNGRHADQLMPVLLALLVQPDFALRTELENAVIRFDSAWYLYRLIEIVASQRGKYTHQIRISAFLILGRLKLPYCLQVILEHLPVLPQTQAREFAAHLSEYDNDAFSKRVLEILNGEDGKVRAAVIAAVPATGNKEFAKPIRNALQDADGLVRSAAVWALMEYGDAKSMKEAKDLLRDPVEQVRIQAAQALAQFGSDDVLKEFSSIVADKHESQSVKLAAIQGLRCSQRPQSVALLSEFLLPDIAEKIRQAAVTALSSKQSKKEVAELISQLKDASSEQRALLMQAFLRMGEAGEDMLVELLREDIASLRPLITEVLEATGYIDATVRKLSHRDSRQRREAAEVLSLIGTAAAFRGIVVASRDPDSEVRVMVTKALEQLASKEGKVILSKLQEDPDRKIRKYTLWALERIKTGEL